MSDPSLSSASPEAGAADCEVDPRAAAAIRLAELQLAMLARIAQVGMRLMDGLEPKQTMEAPAQGEGSPGPAAKATVSAYDRLARSLRLTFEHQTRATEVLRALEAGEAVAVAERRAVAAKRAAEAEDARQIAKMSRVPNLAYAAIDREIGDQADRDLCAGAADERLDDDEYYTGYEDRPVREVLERLLADLGLSPDWSLWIEDEERWADPEPYQRPACSPFNQPSRVPFGDEGYPIGKPRASFPQPRRE